MVKRKMIKRPSKKPIKFKRFVVGGKAIEPGFEHERVAFHITATSAANAKRSAEIAFRKRVDNKGGFSGDIERFQLTAFQLKKRKK